MKERGRLCLLRASDMQWKEEDSVPIERRLSRMDGGRVGVRGTAATTSAIGVNPVRAQRRVLVRLELLGSGSKACSPREVPDGGTFRHPVVADAGIGRRFSEGFT